MSDAHSNDPDELMERRFLALLAEIEVGIAKLTAEKAALQQLIIRVRDKKSKTIDVTRRNSIDRLLVQDRILGVMQKIKTPIFGGYLFDAVRSIVPGMNNSTFRSHLHRMKNRGMIKPSGRRGYWISS
jgi:hypothetical protein